MDAGFLRVDRGIAGEGGEPGLELLQPPTHVVVVDGPEPEDAVVENSGARVFLDADAAQVLDDRVLDAQLDGQGSVQFAVTTQA